MSEPLWDRVVTALGDQYELEGEIGRGGMSVVYRARDRRLNRPVAIKVLPPELAHDPAIRTRFTREAQTSAQLSHAHIVPIYDVGESLGIAYFVMGMVTGGNLAALLAREPRQPVDEVRRLIIEIADALAYAHMRGVIHRDIKPDNVLIDRETGRAMVTDFGIAWAMESATRLTNTGIAVGTPTYMSPEQATGEREIDGRSDVYSLGVVAYQMLTGRVPFTAGNSMALLLKHVSERPRPIADHRADAPRPLRDAIERAMMKSPDDRWPTAAALRDALRSDDMPIAPWRSDRRDPVRYTSPSPDAVRRERSNRDSAIASPAPAARAVQPHRPQGPVATAARAPNAIALEPEHLASLTQPQRADLRLWHGRVSLMDRLRVARAHGWFTAIAAFASLFAFVGGVVESDMAPLIVAPVVPAIMGVKAWKRAQSLRESGLKLRRVYFMPLTRWVLPAPVQPPNEAQLEKLAPREVLESPHAAAIRRAVEERGAIREIVASLSKADRALIPDVEPAVNALVERVAHLARRLHRLDQSYEPRLLEEVERRIAAVNSEERSTEGERRHSLLHRQRDSLKEIEANREALMRQLENAGLALQNLRLDLIKLRSSGLQSALADVTSATQEARALSREIGAVLEAVAEVKTL
jgi:serine/threonine-protein kinase